MDGITLGDLVSVAGFDPVAAWGDVPCLLVKSHEGGRAPMASTSADGTFALDTAELLLGQHLLNGYASPGSVVVPLKKSGRNQFTDLVVGRSASADVRLSDSGVSKVHAYLLAPPQAGGEWRLRDAASTNGTYVAGVRLHVGGRGAMLSPTDEIRFGTVDAAFLDAHALLALIAYVEEALGTAKREADDTDPVPRPRDMLE